MSRVTVWHDGGCPLCRREIALMRRLDRRGRITFVDATGAEGCPVDRADLLARFHAREDGGPMLSGGAAFAAMWRAIPLLRPLGLLARHRPMLGLMERLYLRFLRIRPRLQRRLVRWEARHPASSRVGGKDGHREADRHCREQIDQGAGKCPASHEAVDPALDKGQPCARYVAVSAIRTPRSADAGSADT